MLFLPGTTYKAMGKHEAAIVCFNNQLTLARTIKSWLAEARAQGNIGSTYVALGTSLLDTEEGRALKNLREGLQHLEPAAALAEQHGDVELLIRLTAYLGVAYDGMADFEHALATHRRRIALARECGLKEAEGRAWCNLGNTCRAIGRVDEAIDCYLHDLQLCKDLNDLPGEAVTCHNLAHAYGARADVRNTTAYFEKYIAICTETDDRAGVCSGYGSLARVYQAIGSYDDAMNCLQTQLSVAEEIKDDGEIEAINESIAAVRGLQIERRLVSQEEAINALVAALEAAENKSRSKPSKDRCDRRCYIL